MKRHLPLLALVFVCISCRTPAARVVERDVAKLVECALPKFLAGETPQQVADECLMTLAEAESIGNASHAALSACKPASSGGK